MAKILNKKSFKSVILKLLIAVLLIDLSIPVFLFAKDSFNTQYLSPIVNVSNLSLQKSFDKKKYTDYLAVFQLDENRGRISSKVTNGDLAEFYRDLKDISCIIHYFDQSTSLSGILSESEKKYLRNIVKNGISGIEDDRNLVLDLEKLLNSALERMYQLRNLLVNVANLTDNKIWLNRLEEKLKKINIVITALNNQFEADDIVGSGTNSSSNNSKIVDVSQKRYADLIRELVVINKQEVLFNKRTNEKISIFIESLKFDGLEEAVEVHNKNWGESFRIDYEDGRDMFFSNPGGHLIARDEAGAVIGVIWCVSLSTDSIEQIPGSLELIRGIKRTKSKDNAWLHYAVSVSPKYRDKGFGAQIATLLLKSTEPLSVGMARGTYSPMSGYGQFKDYCSATAYLMRLRPAKGDQTLVGYADYQYAENKMTLREFLISREKDYRWMDWQDYLDFVKYSKFSLGNYIRKTGRSLLCVAANLHLKNGAELVRIIKKGRQGDKDAGEYAMVILYRDLPQKISNRVDTLEEKQNMKISPEQNNISEGKSQAIERAI